MELRGGAAQWVTPRGVGLDGLSDARQAVVGEGDGRHWGDWEVGDCSDLPVAGRGDLPQAVGKTAGGGAVSQRPLPGI